MTRSVSILHCWVGWISIRYLGIQLFIFLLHNSSKKSLLYGMLVHHRATPVSFKFASTHLYTWVGSEALNKVPCPRTGNNIPGHGFNLDLSIQRRGHHASRTYYIHVEVNSFRTSSLLYEAIDVILFRINTIIWSIIKNTYLQYNQYSH